MISESESKDAVIDAGEEDEGVDDLLLMSCTKACDAASTSSNFDRDSS
jgi:hypothetical protein